MVFGTQIRAFAAPHPPPVLPQPALRQRRASSRRLHLVSPVFPRLGGVKPVSCRCENVDKKSIIVDCTNICFPIGNNPRFEFIKACLDVNKKNIVVFPATKDVMECVYLVAEKAARISYRNKEELFNLKEFVTMRETLWRCLTDIKLDRDIINEQFIRLNEILVVIAGEKNISLSMRYKLESLAECISTKILAAYLNENGLETRQIDTFDILYKDFEGLTTGEILEETFAQMFYKNWISNPTKVVIVTSSGLIAKNASGSEYRLGMSGGGATAFTLSKVLRFGTKVIWNDVHNTLCCSRLFYCEAVTFDKAAFGAQAPQLQSIVEGNPMVTPGTEYKALTTTLECKCTKFDIEFTTCFGMTKWFAKGLKCLGIYGKVVVDGENRYLSYVTEPARLTWKIMSLAQWCYQPFSLYFHLSWLLFFRPFWLLYGRHICKFLMLVAQLLLLVLSWIMSMFLPMFQRSDLIKATKLTMPFLLRALKKFSKAFQDKLSQEKERSGVEDG